MKPAVDPEELRQKLKLRHLQIKSDFEARHKEASKYLKRKGLDLGKIRMHSAKLLTAGALAGGLALSVPTSSLALLPPPDEMVEKSRREIAQFPAVSRAVEMRAALGQILPEQTRPLNRDEEKYLERIIEGLTGVSVRASLEGEHLNTTYGKIGAEQHLRRYPGDVNANHAPEGEEYGRENPGEILKEGMAPGLSAWGYFAPSKEALTRELEEIERWYAVVQTLYLPNWDTRQPYLKDWYKYRKVMIVNTNNGRAVVAAVADSGPAAWTGKHFGGSPEVMDYLGGAKYKKGPVLVFFVDDPENKVPLGPVEYNQV